jgi:hypothetical protein
MQQTINEQNVEQMTCNNRKTMTPEENTKLDEILEQNRTLFGLMNGEKGGLGLLQKVEIMWRAHVWVLCTLSAASGGDSSVGKLHQHRVNDECRLFSVLAKRNYSDR